MSAQVVLLLLLSLVPRAPQARLRPTAEAIAAVAGTPREATELIALDWAERGFGLQGPGVPFGATCVHYPGMPLAAAAAGALAVLEAGRVECGPRLEARQHFYRTGRCARPDHEAYRRARLVRRLLRRSRTAMDLQKPSVGRVVHYTLPDGRSAGQARPAMIVRVWDGPGDHVPAGHLPLVQLQVFTDGANDDVEAVPGAGVVWRTSVHYDADGTPGTWRWPPRV